MAKLAKEKKLIDTIEDTFGKGILILPELGGKMYNEEIKTISTGSEIIDKYTGIGGFPFGKIVEILGQEASGKTTLALSVIAQAQKKGLRCAFIDAEQSMSKNRAIELGVDFNKLFICQPDYGEQALNVVDALVNDGSVKIIVIDSVSALVPKAELEGEMNDATIGLMARNMGKALRKITGPTNKNSVLVIFINQIRAMIGGFGFGPRETTSGGNALKFYASIRIDMRRTGNNKKGEKLISTNHKVTIKKNKFFAPMQVMHTKINKEGFML